MTSALASRRRLLGYAATWVVALVVARDLRRARRVTRLAPPTPGVDVQVDPPRMAEAAARTSTSDDAGRAYRARVDGGRAHRTRVDGGRAHRTRDHRGPADRTRDDRGRADRTRDDRGRAKRADAGRPHRTAPIRMAALGDSSIAGVGASRLSTCLAVQIAQRVASGCDRSVHVEGHGVSGARTADIERQVRELDATTPPDVIVIVVGANDVAHLTPPWRFVSALGGLHRQLRERFDAPVVVCSLPEFRAVTVVGRPLRGLAVGYGRLLGVLQYRTLRRAPGVQWVDARRIAGPTFRSRPDAMAADGYHPSDLGYSLLADALAPATISALQRRDGAAT